MEDGSKYLKGDHNQLQQVFINMINNAIHAMPNGGSITIAAREIDSQQPPVNSERVHADKYIEIEFTDTGCGIAKEHLAKIFVPFFTIKEPEKGIGLGLSVSYSIIKDHGDWIPKIFVSFFTTKEPGKGIGLGLSTSYSIIRDHGGWIDVKSNVGEGTTFLIILPAG